MRPRICHRGLWIALSTIIACAPPVIEEREMVGARVVETEREAFDGRSAATGFIVGKVPGAVIMGVAGGGVCRVTVTPAGGEDSVTLDAPPDACKGLGAGDETSILRITRRPAEKPPPPGAAPEVRYEWIEARRP